MLVVKDRTWGKINKDYVDCTHIFYILHSTFSTLLIIFSPFVSGLDVIGSTGCVRAIDYVREEVLLSFYDSDEALYFEWWFPMNYLKLAAPPTAKAPVPHSASTSALLEIQPPSLRASSSHSSTGKEVARLGQCLADLSLVYAHRIVLTFVLNDACALALNTKDAQETRENLPPCIDVDTALLLTGEFTAFCSFHPLFSFSAYVYYEAAI